MKQRLDEEGELARYRESVEDHLALGDDLGLGMGMEQVAAIDDRHSSSLMPWSRPPSVIPGSSIRGSAQKSQYRHAASPLVGKGSIVNSIERYSDAGLVSDGIDCELPSLPSDPMEGLIYGVETNDTNNAEGLDTASQDFLGYVVEQAERVPHEVDSQNRRWIAFQHLANPAEHSKQVAAQAFLHVLSLATKNAISVQQEGSNTTKPFGNIHLGVFGAASADAVH